MSGNTPRPPMPQGTPAQQIRRPGSPLTSPDISYAAVVSGRASPPRVPSQPVSANSNTTNRPRSPPRTRYMGEISTNQNEFYEILYPRPGQARTSGPTGMSSGVHTARPFVAHSSPISQASGVSSNQGLYRTPEVELPSWPTSNQRIRPRPRPIPASLELPPDDEFFTRRPVTNPYWRVDFGSPREPTPTTTVSSQTSASGPPLGQTNINLSSHTPIPPSAPPHAAPAREYIFVHSQTPSHPPQPASNAPAPQAAQPVAPPSAQHSAQPPPPSPGSILDLSYSTGDELTMDERATTPKPAAVAAPASTSNVSAGKAKAKVNPGGGSASAAAGPPAKAKGGKAKAKARGKGKGKGKGKDTAEGSDLESDATDRPQKKRRTKKVAKEGESLATATAKQHAEAALQIHDSDSEGPDMDDNDGDDDSQVGSGRWGQYKLQLVEWWYDADDYEYHKANQLASHKEASTLLFQGKFTRQQVKNAIDGVFRCYKTYKQFINRSGTARPDEDEEKRVRASLSANGVRFSYEQLIRFGESPMFDIMDQVLHHQPEIQKLSNNDPAHDQSDKENDDDDDESTAGKGKAKSRKRARSPDEPVEHLQRMEVVMSESLEMLAIRNRISERELDIATRREAREASTQQTRIDLETRQSRVTEMTTIGSWLESGNPYLVAQAAMIITTHSSSNGPFQSAPFVHPNLLLPRTSPPHSNSSWSHAGPSHTGPSRTGPSHAGSSEAPISTISDQPAPPRGHSHAHTSTENVNDIDMEISDVPGSDLEGEVMPNTPRPSNQPPFAGSTNLGSASVMDV